MELARSYYSYVTNPKLITDSKTRTSGVLMCYKDYRAILQLNRMILKISSESLTDNEFIASSVSNPQMFQIMQIDRINAMVSLASEMISNHKLYDYSIRGIIKAYARVLLNAKDHEIQQHAERVEILTRAIGTAMSLHSKQMEELELVSLLHDIGKIVIPDILLTKSRELNRIEFDEIRKHPETGFQIIQTIPELQSIATYVCCHHERWDGLGYPMGFSEDQIPLLSRILIIADAYDAMTSDRPYRFAMSKEDAIQEIIDHAGTQFDPNIVQNFLRVL